MGLKDTFSKHVNRGGLRLAAIYILVVGVVFAVTAFNTEPSNLGYDWIPFTLLSMPWYRMGDRFLLPGLVANTGLMYLLGSLLDSIWLWIYDLWARPDCSFPKTARIHAVDR